jgi:hypothetical protein
MSGSYRLAPNRPDAVPTYAPTDRPMTRGAEGLERNQSRAGPLQGPGRNHWR